MQKKRLLFYKEISYKHLIICFHSFKDKTLEAKHRKHEYTYLNINKENNINLVKECYWNKPQDINVEHNS